MIYSLFFIFSLRRYVTSSLDSSTGKVTPRHPDISRLLIKRTTHAIDEIHPLYARGQSQSKSSKNKVD